MAPIANLVVRISGQVSELQASFQQAKTQVEGFEAKVQSSAKAVAAAFGVGLTIGGITSFITNVAAAASNIVDLSNKLGISTEAVQRFQFIANQTGVSIETMGKAMFVLGNAIAGDDKSAAAGLEKLGLSLESLAAMKPEERFNAVAIAAGEIGDVTERNAALTQIFGSRTAQELAKAVREWEGLYRSATVAGDASVKAMADAEDAAVAAKDAFIAAAVQGIGYLIIKYGEFREMVRGSTVWLREAEGAIGGWGQALADLVFGAGSGGFTSEGLPGAPGAPPLPPMPERIPPGVKAGTLEYKELEDELNESIKKTNKSFDEAAAKAKAYAESIRDLREQLSGDALQADVKKLDEAWRGLSSSQQDAPLIMLRAKEAADKLRLAGAELTPALKDVTVAWDTWMASLGQIATIPVVERLEQLTANIIPPQLPVTAGIPGGELPGTVVPIELPPEYRLGERIKDNLKRDLVEVPYIIGRALLEGGDVLKNISVDLGSLIGESIGGSIGTALGGTVGGKIGSALGSLLGPLIGKLFGDTEYEKRMKEAAKATQELIDTATAGAGSLDRLRHQFSIVGIQIDEAFKTRDPKWLKEVLDEGYAKTQLLNDAMKEYGFGWESLGAEGRALQLNDALTILKDKTDILRQAGVDYEEVLRRQSSQYSDLVTKAVATNTEIDSSMRPVLQKLVDMGLLVDANGVAFQDLEQVTWAKTLTQGFDQVTLAIKELTTALTKDVGGALDNISKRKVTIPIRYEVEAPPGGLGAGAASVESPSQTITVNLDSDPIVKSVVRNMPRELELNGV